MDGVQVTTEHRDSTAQSTRFFTGYCSRPQCPARLPDSGLGQKKGIKVKEQEKLMKIPENMLVVKINKTPTNNNFQGMFFPK